MRQRSESGIALWMLCLSTMAFLSCLLLAIQKPVETVKFGPQAAMETKVGG